MQIDFTPEIFVSYDTDGTIIGIGPAIVEGYNYFKTEYSAVEKFLTLEEDPLNYVVKYSSTDKAYKIVSLIISKDKEYKFVEVEKLLDSDFDLLLSIDNTKKTAVLKADKILKGKLNITDFSFYFTKKDNPNFLYKTITFSLDQEVTDDMFEDTNYSMFTVRNLEKIYYEVV